MDIPVHARLFKTKMAKLKIKLDPWQEKFINTEGDKILCCGRQVGKSVICGIDAGEYSATHNKKLVLMIAPTERQAFELFDKTLNYLLDNYSSLIKKGKDRPTKSLIKLKNGTKIYCLPTGLSGLGIRGYTVDRLYADEASRIPEDVWTAVTPMMLTTGGDSIYLSTPAGRGNTFADTMLNTDNAYNSFSRFSVSSREVISEREICETWHEFQREKALQHLDREASRMSTLQYAQEYEGQLVDELRQFFPTDLIRDCMTLTGSEYNPENYTTYGGVDVARMGGDEFVITSIADISGKFAAMIGLDIFKNIRITEGVRNVKDANRKYKYKNIYIDDGGMGVGVFDPLLEDNETKRKVIAINNASRSIDREGQRTKRLLKEDLYNNLLSMMEQNKIRLFKNDDLFHSLKSIQAEYSNGKLIIFGNYSDITESLIRAVWGIRTKSLNIYIY